MDRTVIYRGVRLQKPSKSVNVFVEKPIEETVVQETVEKVNEVIKEEKVMDTKEKIAMANEILGDNPMKAKRVKRDRGLIERTESSTIILTEDNKELLKD